MSCITLSGYTLDCDKSSGGVKKIYLVEWADVTSYAQSAAGVVTGIVLVTGGVVFKDYEIQQEDSDWTETNTSVLENRTIAWNQLLRLKMHKNNAAARTEVIALSKFVGIAIVQNFNGEYFLLGADSGLNLTNTTASSSGVKREDLDGWVIELSANEKNPAPEVLSTIVAALLV